MSEPWFLILPVLMWVVYSFQRFDDEYDVDELS